MSEEQKPKKASQNKSFWKANRIAKRKSLYANQFGLTDRNKKRKLRRHLRDFPHDAQAVKKWEQVWGPAKDLGLTAKGRRRTAMALAGKTGTKQLRISAVMELVKDVVRPQTQG